MKEFYSQAFPVKSKIVSQKNYNNPWVNNRLRQLIKIKSAYCNWLRLGIVTKHENNTVKKRINAILIKAKKYYYENLFESCRKDVKSTWCNIRNILGRGRGKCHQKPGDRLIVGGRELTNPFDVAQAFNAHFCSIGSLLDGSLPNYTVDPLSFISYSNLFSLGAVTPSECMEIISNLKNT